MPRQTPLSADRYCYLLTCDRRDMYYDRVLHGLAVVTPIGTPLLYSIRERSTVKNIATRLGRARTKARSLGLI